MICVDDDMGCDGVIVMVGSILVTVLVIMNNVTGDSMDGDSGDEK